MIKVGIIGVGTVGSSVALILEKNKEIITARAGKEIVVKMGAVKDKTKTHPDVNIPLTTNIDDIVNDPEIDIVVELMGGVEFPFEVAKKALKNGKHYVTANKAMLAYHRYELQESAGSLAFGYEASVAGGIPIIKALKNGLSANHINSIRGIMNGTCNYILTKMINEGVSYDKVLKEAQELGYAEADPTFDVGGYDAAHKLLILSSIAFGIDAKPEDILIEGIQDINEDDIEFAEEFWYKIKLLGIAKRNGKEVELRVHPTMVPRDEMIAKVDGVMNGISVVGDCVGETVYYGAGAGGDATASAVISDIIDIVRHGDNTNRTPMLGFKKPMEDGLRLMPKESIVSKYYLRIEVKDIPGVLAKISQILGDHSISIEALLQRPSSENKATLMLSTHQSSEKSIQSALSYIEALEIVLSKPSMIRIEG